MFMFQDLQALKKICTGHPSCPAMVLSSHVSSHHRRQRGAARGPFFHSELGGALLHPVTWVTISHLFPSLHPSQVQTQWHIFFWRSSIQVLACCRFDPKCKPVFFFSFLLREAQHLFPFSSRAQIPSRKLSPGFASAAL